MTRRAKWLWLAGYALLLGLLVMLLVSGRRQVLQNLSTPEARQQWEAWREAAARQAEAGPVRRRPPKSPEPPALVLMRDHFTVVATAAVVFSTLLYGMLVFAIEGSRRRS